MSGYGIYTLISDPAVLPKTNVIQGDAADSLRPVGLSSNLNAMEDAAAVAVVPAFKFVARATLEKNIYVGTDNIFYMDTSAGGSGEKNFAESLGISLPSGVSAIRSMVVTTGQTASSAMKTFLVLLSDVDSRIYYCSSKLDEYAFGGWTQVSTTASPVFRRPYFMTTLQQSANGVGVVVCGRFMDANNKYYGVARASLTDFQSWDVLPNSAFSEVNGALSYARGTSILSDGTYMFGKIFNDERSNLYAVNIQYTMHRYSDPYMDIAGVEEMSDLVELKNKGRVGLLIPAGSTYGSFIGCSGPGPVGAAKGFALWDSTLRRWDRVNDGVDPTKNIPLSDMAIISSNFATDYQQVNYVLAIKCSELFSPTATVYYINIIPSSAAVTDVSFRIDFITIPSLTSNVNNTLTLNMLKKINGTYPVTTSGVSSPSSATSGSSTADDKEVESTSILKNKWVWLIAAFFILGLVGIVYYNMVMSIGRSQQNVKKLMDEYLKGSTPAAPAAPASVKAAFGRRSWYR